MKSKLSIRISRIGFRKIKRRGSNKSYFPRSPRAWAARDFSIRTIAKSPQIHTTNHIIIQ